MEEKREHDMRNKFLRISFLLREDLGSNKILFNLSDSKRRKSESTSAVNFCAYRFCSRTPSVLRIEELVIFSFVARDCKRP